MKIKHGRTKHSVLDSDLSGVMLGFAAPRGPVGRRLRVLRIETYG